MKPIFKILFASISLMFFLSSCSKKLTPFTERLHDQYRWTDSDLERIQFYLSEDIVLRRVMSGGKSEIAEGKIRSIDGKQVEEIVFKKGTPGVFVFSPKSDRMGISFETGGGDAFLMFGPNSKLNGKYVLLAKDWDRRTGKVTYDGKTYSTSYESAYATLLVDLKTAQQVKYSKTTVGGRTVKN